MYSMSNLGRLKTLDANAPGGNASLLGAFDRAAMAGGAIPRKFKELMATPYRSQRNACTVSRSIRAKHGKQAQRTRRSPKW